MAYWFIEDEEKPNKLRGYQANSIILDELNGNDVEVWAICDNKPSCKWTGPLGKLIDGCCPICKCESITTWT